MGSLLELIPALHLASPGQHQVQRATKGKVLAPSRLGAAGGAEPHNAAQSAAVSPSCSSSASALSDLRPIECSNLKDSIGRGLGDAAATVCSMLRPKGPGIVEEHSKALNVLTSLPYVALGWWTFSQRSSFESKAYGASLMGVGAGATVFHLTDGTSGLVRMCTRKLDYWCIAASTAAMVKAVFPDAPMRATVAALLATPFQPFTVSSSNIAAMEVEYLRRARANPQLRRAHTVHSLSLGLGAACFFLEDLVPGVPGVHSAWHCLSAIALATTNPLLTEVDRSRAGAHAQLKTA